MSGRFILHMVNENADITKHEKDGRHFIERSKSIH